jgi:hypothetical protein
MASEVDITLRAGPFYAAYIKVVNRCESRSHFKTGRDGILSMSKRRKNEEGSQINHERT